MILSNVAVLRLHAVAVRAGLVTRTPSPERVREALRLARVLVGAIRDARDRATPDLFPAGPTESRADETTAVLVAFAATWRIFGSGYETVVMVDLLLHAQASHTAPGWSLGLPMVTAEALIVETMFRADRGLPIDYAGLARTIASVMAPRGAVQVNPPARLRALRHPATSARLGNPWRNDLSRGW